MARWSERLSKCLLIYWDFHTGTSIAWVFTEIGAQKEKISSERQLRAEKCVDVRGQRNLVRLVGDHGQATVTHITTGYNQDLENSISNLEAVYRYTHSPLKKKWMVGALAILAGKKILK